MIAYYLPQSVFFPPHELDIGTKNEKQMIYFNDDIFLLFFLTDSEFFFLSPKFNYNDVSKIVVKCVFFICIMFVVKRDFLLGSSQIIILTYYIIMIII